MGQRTGRYNTFHLDDHSLCFGGTYNNRKLAFATHFTQYQGIGTRLRLAVGNV